MLVLMLFQLQFVLIFRMHYSSYIKHNDFYVLIFYAVIPLISHIRIPVDSVGIFANKIVPSLNKECFDISFLIFMTCKFTWWP